jgi:hypothetical protein
MKRPTYLALLFTPSEHELLFNCVSALTHPGQVTGIGNPLEELDCLLAKGDERGEASDESHQTGA